MSVPPHDQSAVERQIEDLPPSPTLVLRVLLQDAPCSPRELRKRTWLPMPTVRWALRRLEEDAMAEAARDPLDARRRLWLPASHLRNRDLLDVDVDDDREL